MFNARPDRPSLPAERSERLVRVEITVPRPEGSQARKPVHLSLVIDRSGSMTGEKLRLALEAARQAIRTLQPGDRFSVVTFDHQVEVPIPSTEVTPGARLRAEAALDTVTARGNTDLSGGWLRGCAEVGAHLPEDAIGRVLLLTDGQANHGITSPDELIPHARSQRLRRVTTSTIGLGEGFNEFLLGRLSEEGGGNFYFAARADELPGLSKKGHYYDAMMAMKMGGRGRARPGPRVLGVPTAARLAPLLRTASQALGGVKGAPAFDVDVSFQGAPIPAGPLSQRDEDELAADADSLDPGALKVVFVEQPLPDRWFSHWHPGYRTAVISLAGLDQLISLPAASFVAYELLLYGLHALSADYEPAKLLHTETLACLFDLCQQKAEVGIKLQAERDADAVQELGVRLQKMLRAAPRETARSAGTAPRLVPENPPLVGQNPCLVIRRSISPPRLANWVPYDTPYKTRFSVDGSCPCCAGSSKPRMRIERRYAGRA